MVESVGFRVFATARKLSSVKDLADLGIETLQLDVTSDESVQSARDKVKELNGGTLDILVNNA